MSTSLPGAATTGSSVYKTWATTLRTWSRVPSTSLDGLPPLTAESFSPRTFSRLVDHLVTAVSTMMDGWNESFARSWEHALASGDVHTIESALVDARRLLLPRLRLSTHPSLPQELRENLMTSMRKDVESLQHQLEEAVSSTRAGRVVSDPTGDDRLVRVVRENSLMRVFDTGYVDGSAIIGLADRASAPGPVGGTPATRTDEPPPPRERRGPGLFRRMTRRRK